MQLDLLLITPPYHSGVVEAACQAPNVGFVYLAGHARAAGFAVQIYDAMTKYHNLEQIKEHIRQCKPRFVASTGYTSSFPAAVQVLAAAKEVSSSIITVLGGVHANFMYSDILEQHRNVVDYVVRGEGEETLPELMNCLDNGMNLQNVPGIAYREEGQILATPERSFIHNLDNLIPAWDLVDWEDYTFHVMEGSRLSMVSSSRGCSNNCSFCSQKLFWKQTFRARSAESFVDELQELRQKYGVNVVMLSDEYPTRDGERWERILDLLIERQVGVYLLMETCVEDILRDAGILEKYRRAGVIHIYVGVESTDPDRLMSFQKNIAFEQSKECLRLLAEAGIISECSFVLGMPDETKESVAKTLQLTKLYGPDFAHFLHIAPWPYAELYADLKPYIKEFDYSKYNFTEPIVEPEQMTLTEMKQSVFDCYKSYYMERMKAYMAIPDKFRRDYIIRSVELMVNNSFLKDHMAHLRLFGNNRPAHLAKAE